MIIRDSLYLGCSGVSIYGFHQCANKQINKLKQICKQTKTNIFCMLNENQNKKWEKHLKEEGFKQIHCYHNKVHHHHCYIYFRSGVK